MAHRQHNKIFSIFSIASMLLSASMATSSLAQTPPTLGLADSVIETFHDSETMKCGSQKIHIDGPIRAFEDEHHVIHLTVSDPQAKGWQWTGSVTGFTNNPKTAVLDCDPVMEGNSGINLPEYFDQKTWIQALFFPGSGSYVYAYGHGDYFGTRTSETGCHKAGVVDGLPYCWYSSIPVWESLAPTSSSNRDLDFVQSGVPPDHVAIYPHVEYPGHSSTPTAGWIGYGTPSNIVRGRDSSANLDGYWYMFVYTNSGHASQPKGVCLFRSDDPSDRTSWRAWNGSTSSPQFTQVMANPYDTTNQPCAVVSPSIFSSYVRSVVYHKPSKHYVAIIRNSSAVQYSTSTDLLTWNTPQTLLVSTSAQANYTTAIDFDAGDYGDDNFDRIHDNGKSYIFYRKSIAWGHTRITRRKIEVTNYAADPPGSSNP